MSPLRLAGRMRVATGYHYAKCRDGEITLPQTPEQQPSRRDVLRKACRGACAAALGAAGLSLAATRNARGERLWQIDPRKCMQCGKCAVNCVLEVSAVKCVHNFTMCGYCDFCTGFFEPQSTDLTTAAENQLCPTGALERTKIEDERFEYDILEDLCVGCAKCVKGCTAFGNGSLFMQVRHDLCLGCNECAIAAACPAQAFVRVPAGKPYLLKPLDQAT